MSLREHNEKMRELDYARDALRGARDAAAREVADLAVAGLTDTDAFALALKTYRGLSRDFENASTGRP